MSVRLLGVSAAAGAENMVKTMSACRGMAGAYGAAAAAADVSGSASARGTLRSTSRALRMSPSCLRVRVTEHQ